MDEVTKQILTSAVRKLDAVIGMAPDTALELGFEVGIRPQLVGVEEILRGLLERKPDEPDAHYTAATLADEVVRLRRTLRETLSALVGVWVAARDGDFDNASGDYIRGFLADHLGAGKVIQKAEEVLR